MELLHFISLFLLCFWTCQTVANSSNGQTANKCSKPKLVFQIFQTSHCLLCPLNAFFGRCPLGTQKLTAGMGLRKCILGSNRYGCVHLCRRTIVQSVCCQHYWGPDCQPCPGLESGQLACFGNGQCNDLDAGNGTCQCNTSFEGFACELCTDKTKFGIKCHKDCTCKNGECVSGVLGDGTCTLFSCKKGYHGSNCEIFEPSCNINCHKHSHCNGDKKSCKCNPGYSGNGTVCEEIDPCKPTNVLCPKNTVCNKTGPGRHKCVCRQGYRGDGVVCTAIDRCQTNNGNCPNNTQCNYLGPGKANCTCLLGYNNNTAVKGCSLINLCIPDKDCLAFNAECVMTAPGVKECRCKSGYVGNGTVCHGNILQRIDDLHGYGQFKDKFIHVKNIIKQHSDLTFAFTDRGPFTIFLPTDDGLEKKFTSSQLRYIIKDKQLVHDLILVHSAPAYLPTSLLNVNGNLTTLKGWDAVVTNNGGLFYQLSGRVEKPSITRSDISASNGILHVINEPVWTPDFTNITNTSSKTLWQVIVERSELRTFRDFIQLADMGSELKTTTNDLTVIAPINEAFANLDKNDTEFLRSPKGKAKLQAIIRHHIFGLKIGIIDLSYESSIMSLAAELVNVNVTDKGALLLGGKSKLIDNNIPAANGYLHLTDTLLLPSFVLPIVQRHCDNNPTIVNSPCRPCRLTYINGNCPQGTVTTGQKRPSCLYRIKYFLGSRIFVGCQSKCVPAVKQCCQGFYGSDCSSCPGPVGHPCFGNGQCLDGQKGDGTCKCKSPFKGTACELCKNSNMFGLDCKKPCTCIHGTCDNGRFGKGSCVPNSCRGDFRGKECGIALTSCGGHPHVKAACHIHANCYLNNSQPICLCKTGYEQVGENCYEIDPCLADNRGGCHKNAICTKTGPGRSNCTCSVGWTGDGTYCTPINYCAMPSRGHCHRNAKCTFLGPAQVKCECYPGYEGDGTSCREINTCLKNNGNCSPLARCIKTGPGKNKCNCRVGYLGDGITCLGSLSVVAQRQKELTIISSLMVKYNLIRYAANPNQNMTMFLPSDAAISDLDAERRKFLDVPENLFYVGGSNTVPGLYMLSDLRNKAIEMLPSLFKGVNITINHTKSGEPLIGGIAKIITANITASNGILHIVDKVLFPAFVGKPRTEPTVFQGLCFYETNFKEMCNFIRKFNLQEKMKSCNHCSIFVPTDQAFNDLHHTGYHNISRKDILYHMTNHFISPRSILDGQQFTSLAGNFYMLSFENDSTKIKVNGVRPTYYKSNSTWIIYTIPVVLQAVKNTCYEDRRNVFKTVCRPCRSSSLRCRVGYGYVGKEDCLYIAFGSRFIGCRAVCEKPIKIRECCPGFYGGNCTACPGENGKVCFGNGKCDDSRAGSGHCACNETFGGLACERCKPGHYGQTCKHCSCYGNAICDQKNGFCRCPRDKKGIKCDKKATNETCGHGNLTFVCHQHASCSKNGTKNAICKCDYGFNGNGTYCIRIDLCEKNNGGCSPYATCTFDASTLTRSCACKTPNYGGDGFYCQGVNHCVEKPRPKCHDRADCLYLRPGRASCKCKAGYTGDGKNNCFQINPCSQDNGGCSFFADCAFNKTTLNTSCTCKEGYIGDGIKCNGNVLESLQNDPNLREFNSRLQKSSIKQILSPENHVSVVAPNNNAFLSSRRKRRSVETLSDSDLKYYVVSCVSLSEKDANTRGQSFVTVAGSWLNITSAMVINNNVTILSVKTVRNSAILVVDKLLDIPDSDDDSLENMTLTDVAKSKGYGKFVQLLTGADMLDIVSNIYHRPHTMFWPSDEAFSRLPVDIQGRLSDKDYARDIINYHIIEKTKITTNDILSYSGGLSRRTREGSPLYISCKGHKGDLYVNDRSKIIERDIGYQGGIAFGISEVLLPPGVAGRCDEIKYDQVQGSCTACGDNGFCPPGAILESVDKNSSCVYQGQYIGCLSRCIKRTKVPKCCKNFYGADCQACPGGFNPCSGRGSCAYGTTGSGNCTCVKPFIGWNCEICRNDEQNCSIIIHRICASRYNPCSIFATCDAKRTRLCQCFSGYEGDGYYCQEIDKCQKNNGGCSKHAICKYTGPNSASCECRSGYVGDGFTCTALSPSHPCAINNVRCHVHAQCSDKGGAADCRCRQNFVGDGILCAGTVKDVIYDIEELSEFSKSLKRLSWGVEGHAIIRHLSSEKDYTVFAPINYGFTLKSMNINQLKNHIVEGKLSLKPGTTKTVLSLARNSITIVVSKNNDTRLNKIASVVSYYPSTNGIVIVIDHIIPYKKPPPTPHPTTPHPTSKPTTNTGGSVSVNINHGKDRNTVKIIGITVGVTVVVVLVLAVIYFLKKRCHSYNVKYNRNFENVLLESEVYTEEDPIDDDEYEHQTLQHPSTEMKGTLQNPTYVGTDADIQDDLLEMTETSSSVPLTEHDASSLSKIEKC